MIGALMTIETAWTIERESSDEKIIEEQGREDGDD